MESTRSTSARNGSGSVNWRCPRRHGSVRASKAASARSMRWCNPRCWASCNECERTTQTRSFQCTVSPVSAGAASAASIHSPRPRVCHHRLSAGASECHRRVAFAPTPSVVRGLAHLCQRCQIKMFPLLNVCAIRQRGQFAIAKEYQALGLPISARAVNHRQIQ